MLKFKIKERIGSLWLLKLAIIFFILILLVASYFIFEKKYEGRNYPNLYLGDIYLGGKTFEDTKEIINQEINKINKEGIIFYYEGNSTEIHPIIASLESDLAYQVIDFDVEETAKDAFNFGRENNFFINLNNRIKALIFKKHLNLSMAVNEEEIKKSLRDKFSRFEIPGEDAKLVYKKNSLEENIDFEVTKEKLGKVIEYERGINNLKTNLARLNNDRIELFSITNYPKIYKEDALNIDSQAEKILSLSPLSLKYGEEEWTVEKETLIDWLVLKNSSDLEGKNSAIVGLNETVVNKFLEENIAQKINQEPIEAKFEIKDGKVIEFQAGRDGLALDKDASFFQIESSLLNNAQNKIDLAVKKSKSKNSIGDVNSLGIKEIIGTGKSDFSGSPVNRRHNIGVGARTLNGILIKPGEEFSLLGALGKINAESGYRQELVIKDNKTIPEYGGGLCQIGTTMFRGALASGLEITQRRNHSYRVAYYEPAGTDATIYDPWPDLRFKNDSPGHILIQFRIEGNSLYFDFWGTEDGRIAEQTNPVIYNIIKPAPTRLVETTDLPVGEKKCTERAHNGADANFHYKVTYANGEIKEKTFSSHYVPWQEVCLIGVEKLSEEKAQPGEEAKTENNNQ